MLKFGDFLPNGARVLHFATPQRPDAGYVLVIVNDSTDVDFRVGAVRWRDFGVGWTWANLLDIARYGMDFDRAYADFRDAVGIIP